MTIRSYDPLTVGRMFRYVRESTVENRGLRVESVQHWSSGQFGDSWCAEWLTFVLDICYQGEAPIPRQGSCEEVRQFALAKDWETVTPVPGDIIIRVKDNHGHHIGFFSGGVPQTGSFTMLSGNTSEDGTSSNGDRVAEHGVISLDGDTFIHLP